uniref:histone deacetylase family protein n=1 Tax=Undibacterium sp. TaxID=1914977 RepID=UPI00374D98EE
MQIFHNPVHHLHQGRHEMFRGRLVPCHEVPDRLDHVLAELQRRPAGTLHTPPEVAIFDLERIHSRRYLDFLAGAWDEWVALDPANADIDALPSVWPARSFRHDILPANFAARMGLFSFDAGTPLTAGTWTAARAGAACAVSAARVAASSTAADPHHAFALSRPPGHHAGADFFGGYCFLNNAALAVQTLLDSGLQRVAVLDVDYHHGNGTQSIFYERSDVLTVSLHGDPSTEYPFFLGYADESGAGAGLGYNLNLPMPRGTTFPAWRQALQS